MAELSLITGCLAVLMGALLFAVGLFGWGKVSLKLWLFVVAGLEAAEWAVQTGVQATRRPQNLSK